MNGPVSDLVSDLDKRNIEKKLEEELSKRKGRMWWKCQLKWVNPVEVINGILLSMLFTSRGTKRLSKDTPEILFSLSSSVIIT